MAATTFLDSASYLADLIRQHSGLHAIIGYRSTSAETRLPQAC
jgi:hypothetical protein